MLPRRPRTRTARVEAGERVALAERVQAAGQELMIIAEAASQLLGGEGRAALIEVTICREWWKPVRPLWID